MVIRVAEEGRRLGRVRGFVRGILGWWKKRPTLILNKPLLGRMGIIDPPAEMLVPLKLDRHVELAPEEIVNLIAQTSWARGIAEGLARRGGLKPGTKAYKTFVENLARAVARGLAESSGLI